MLPLFMPCRRFSAHSSDHSGSAGGSHVIVPPSSLAAMKATFSPTERQRGRGAIGGSGVRVSSGLAARKPASLQREYTLGIRGLREQRSFRPSTEKGRTWRSHVALHRSRSCGRAGGKGEPGGRQRR